MDRLEGHCLEPGLAGRASHIHAGGGLLPRAASPHAASDGHRLAVEQVITPAGGRVPFMRITRPTGRTIELHEDRIPLEASRHDPFYQQVVSQHIFVSGEGIRFYPVKLLNFLHCIGWKIYCAFNNNVDIFDGIDIY